MTEVRPAPWIAALLSFWLPPLGFLYARRVRWALAYLFILVVLGIVSLWLIGYGMPFPIAWLVSFVAAAHVFLIAKRASPSVRPWYARWYGLAAMVIVLFTAVLLIRCFLYEPFHVPAQSMQPTIPQGSYLIVRKWGYGNYQSFGIRLADAAPSAELRRGDVMVFEHPNDPDLQYVKRLVGLPGDRVAMRGKRLFVNGEAAAPPNQEHVEVLQGTRYRIAIDADKPAKDVEIEVPAGHLYFLGDNRDRSSDSRHFGPVPIEKSLGRVVQVWGREQ